MTVALPSRKGVQASPYLIDPGGIVGGSLGGPDQRINRMGARWGVEYQLPPMKGEEARIWIARLIRGTREKASYYFPQPGVSLPPNTTVAAAAVSNAEIIRLAPGAYLEGYFCSIVRNGRRYVHQLTTDGTDFVGIQPPLRTSMVGGELVVFRNALIEGFVKADRVGWTIDNAKIYGLSFRIEE